MGHHGLLLTLFVLVLNAVATLQQCTDPVDIVFVLDGSNAVGTDGNLRVEMAALTSVISTLNIGPGQILAGAVLSDGMNNQNVFLRDNVNGISNGINSWRYQGGENRLDLGLRNALTMLTSVGRANTLEVIVLILNGIPSANVIHETIRLADQARSQNVHVFAIGIGSGGNPASQLVNIANGQTNVRTATDPTYMNTVLSQALPQACANALAVDDDTPTQTCEDGNTDVYFVVDVSQTASGLSQNFGLVRNALNQLVSTLRSRLLTDDSLRMGLISYSGTAILAHTMASVNAHTVTNAITAIPNNLYQGNSNLLNALRLITTHARAGEYRSYVVIVTPTDVTQSQDLTNEVQRVKSLGYTLVGLTVQNGNNNFLTLQNLVQYSMPVNGYTNLGTVLNNFDRDHLCAGPRPNKMPGVCANSGHQTTGMAYVSHPSTCMHYVQCYYNAKKEFDLAVVRQCPAGLFWNAATSMCDSPKASLCPNDPCKDMCEPYAMKHNCRGFYKCKDGVSMPSCCSDGYKFVEGKGCVMDKMFTCMDHCNMTNTYCKKPACNKKPNWAYPGSYDFSTRGTSRWFTGPCWSKNFNALTCKCSAPKDHECRADMLFDFKDTSTVEQIQAGTKTGVTVTQGTYNNAGVTIPNRGMIHVDVASKKKNEPLTIKFRYRETASSLDVKQGTVLMASSYKCSARPNGGLTMHISTDFVGAVFMNPFGESAHIHLPTKGLAPTEFKDVTLVYDDGRFALSVKGYYQQYMQEVFAPRDLSFPCGFDFGSTRDYNGFQGTFEMIAVSTCTPSKLY